MANRIDSTADFLTYLDAVEEELTAPAADTLADPLAAQKGDRLADGFTVLKRLGEGATSVAHLVERGGEEFILKVANSEDHGSQCRLWPQAVVYDYLHNGPNGLDPGPYSRVDNVIRRAALPHLRLTAALPGG